MKFTENVDEAAAAEAAPAKVQGSSVDDKTNAVVRSTAEAAAVAEAAPVPVVATAAAVAPKISSDSVAVNNTRIKQCFMLPQQQHSYQTIEQEEQQQHGNYFFASIQISCSNLAIQFIRV